MKKTALIFFSLLTFSLMAQSDSTKHLSRWQIGITENIGAINFGWENHPKYNFAIAEGVNGEFKICKRLSARAGIEYLTNKYEEARPLIFFDSWRPSPCPILSLYVYGNYQNTYIFLPLDLKLIFLHKRKFNVFISAGLLNAFHKAKGYEEIVRSDGTFTKSDYSIPFHYSNIQPSFSLGGSFKLNEKLNFVIEPNISLPRYSYNFFTGCKIGMLYSF